MFLEPDWRIEAGMRAFEFFRWAGAVHFGNPPDTMLQDERSYAAWKRYMIEVGTLPTRLGVWE